MTAAAGLVPSTSARDPAAPPTMGSIVWRHADDAAFLWLTRDHATRAPHPTLDDLARLDRRIEAHLDGLRIAGSAGWAACAEGLSHRDAGEVFAAASLAIDTGDDARLGAVLEVAAAIPNAGRGLIAALAWTDRERALPIVPMLLDSSVPALRSAGLAAATAHGEDPGATVLNTACLSGVPVLRRHAFMAVGRLGFVDRRPCVAVGLADPEPACRFAAAYSLAALASTESLPVLRSIAQGDGSRREPAAALAARLLDPKEARCWLRELAGLPSSRRVAIVFAGAAGDASAIPWLIDQMRDDAVARVAGEAFTSITGVDLARRRLEQPRPRDVATGPTEDPADEDVSMDPDEHLPWPSPHLVEAWWDRNRSRFATETRYFLGEPISDASLHRILREGRQRQRAAAALERKLRAPGDALFDVRAPASRQRRELVAT